MPILQKHPSVPLLAEATSSFLFLFIAPFPGVAVTFIIIASLQLPFHFIAAYFLFDRPVYCCSPLWVDKYFSAIFFFTTTLFPFWQDKINDLKVFLVYV